MKVELSIFLVAMLVVSAAGHEVEARGKAKYALLTHLAILLAAKVGLFKICMGIALVLASMKVLVILAWALAIFKYVPDPYIYSNSHEYKIHLHLDHNPFDHDRYDQNVHFFYVVATKLFVLKIVYGAIFYALIVKGWHFVSWFIHYLKEKKQVHHEFVEYHQPHHEYHGQHDQEYHGHHDHEYYGHHDHEYQGHHGHGHYKNGPDFDSYGPYAYKKLGYSASGFKKAYDADGSYSIKSI